jgi:hypothetical protein
VDILYSGDDPNEVRIDSFFSVYGIGAIFTAFGVLFIVIGLWAGRKRTAAIAGRATGGTPLPGTGPRPEVPAEPKSTDPSQPGHVHEPKPKQPSVVQRMR